MKLKLFKEFNNNISDLSNSIDRMKFISKELKEYSKPYINSLTKIVKAKIYGLEKSKEMNDRIEELGAKNGFSMGIDKNGIFIHTHRGRSKSKEKISEFTKDDFNKIDSTG